MEQPGAEGTKKRYARRVFSPTLRQLAYIQGRIRGLSVRAAAREAGYASVGGSTTAIEKNPDFQALLRAALEENHVTMETIARKIAEGLDATVIQSFCTRAGTLLQTAPMDDFRTRHQYVETASKLLGLFPDKGNGTATIVQNNIAVMAQKYEGMSQEELLAAMAQRRQEMNQRRREHTE